MHILFDEAGKLLTGRLLSEAESSLQVELESGKRVKVKAVNALLRFEKPAPAALMSAATELSTDMDLALAYEFAPEDEFGFADLAREYFSSSASTAEQVAALLCLQGAPHYFRRAGKGRYKKAPADILAQALAGIEKKKQQQAQIEAWAADLASGTCPEPVRQQLYKILFKPDKNAPEYKAVVDASRDLCGSLVDQPLRRRSHLGLGHGAADQAVAPLHEIPLELLLVGRRPRELGPGR